MAELLNVLTPWFVGLNVLLGFFCSWKCILWRNRARKIQCVEVIFPEDMPILRSHESRRNRWGIFALLNFVSILGTYYPIVLFIIVVLGLSLSIDVWMVPLAYLLPSRVESRTRETTSAATRLQCSTSLISPRSK